MPAKGLVEDPYGEPNRAKGGEASAPSRSYPPYAGRKYPTRAVFGDTHHPTSKPCLSLSGRHPLPPGLPIKQAQTGPAARHRSRQRRVVGKSQILAEPDNGRRL